MQGESLCCSAPKILEHNDFVRQSAPNNSWYLLFNTIGPSLCQNVRQKPDEFFLCSEDLLEIGTQIHPGLTRL